MQQIQECGRINFHKQAHRFGSDLILQGLPNGYVFVTDYRLTSYKQVGKNWVTTRVYGLKVSYSKTVVKLIFNLQKGFIYT